MLFTTPVIQVIAVPVLDHNITILSCPQFEEEISQMVVFILKFEFKMTVRWRVIVTVDKFAYETFCLFGSFDYCYSFVSISLFCLDHPIFYHCFNHSIFCIDRLLFSICM